MSPGHSNTRRLQYSGFFASASAAYIQQQNDLIAADEYQPVNGVTSPVALPLGTLGINNGCIDIESQISYYPTMMVNNTYGIKVVPDDIYLEARELADACYGLINECRAAATEFDPEGMGNVPEVNAICVNVTETCFLGLTAMYLSSNVSTIDLASLLTILEPRSILCLRKEAVDLGRECLLTISTRASRGHNST